MQQQGNLFQRSYAGLSLTPWERALLRLVEGLGATALLAGLTAIIPLLGGSTPNWGMVWNVGGAAAVTAVFMALLKYMRAFGDAPLPLNAPPDSGAPAIAAQPASPTPAAPAALASAIMSAAPPALNLPTHQLPAVAWDVASGLDAATAGTAFKPNAAMAPLMGSGDGLSEGGWDDPDPAPVSPGASGRFRTLADMPQPSAATRPVALPSPPPSAAAGVPSPIQTPTWLLRGGDPAATQDMAPAASTDAAATAPTQQEGLPHS